MPKMSDREILAAVNSEFESAMGAPNGDISIERAKNLDFYLSKALGNEVDGQSQVVTTDVADVVDGMMPSLLRLFTIKENLVGFDPVGPEDEAQAEQESDYVNYVFFKQNQAFEILYTWFFDALVQKNGIVKAWYDESEVVTTENYSQLTEDELLELLSDDELEPIERAERVENGFVTHDVMFKRTSKEGRFRVENVPPEEYRISSDAKSVDPCGARMVGQEREVTRSDLIAMGFESDLVLSLPTHTETHFSSEEEISRYSKTDETHGGFADTSQEQILVREAYIKMDYEGTGRSELRQVICAGNTLLSNEPADRQPFHVICPQPLPHKHFGRCPAERVIDIQEISTTLLRQSLDNLYHTNNPGHAVWEQGMSENTLDDLLTTRVGGIKRFSRPPSESWMPISIPFTAGDSLAALEYFDKQKRDRTGVNADSEGLSPEQLKNIQSSVMAQANDLSRMKIEVVARVFAETGIKSLFLHLHELILKHRNKQHSVKLRNEWVDINPASWRTRYDMTVNIGLGIGTREQNLLHLNTIKDLQSEIIAGGGLGLVVTPQNIYNTAAEFVKNANFKNPEEFFNNPQNIDPAMLQQEEQEDPQVELLRRQQEIEAQRLILDKEKSLLQHEREMLKIQGVDKAREDKLTIEMEKIRNDIAELELKYKKDIPGNDGPRYRYNPVTEEISEA